jgi:uncharacterized repeat protein (TIGR03803 family)
MISLRGTLYGTTEWGGTDNAGTLFSITPSGQEKIVYSFNSKYNDDGTEPDAGVTSRTASSTARRLKVELQTVGRSTK